jgi:hypothetical protein
LTPADRDKLLELVRGSDQIKPLTEEEFETMLLERGILVARPTRLPTPSWKPIEIPGPPLSQTIIEDRR